MPGSIRAIDGGGSGFRRADVCGDEVENLVTATRGQIFNPQQLVEFARADLPKNCIGIAFAVAGEIHGGTVVKSPQIHWLDGFNLSVQAAGISGETVTVVNDMDGAVIGMAKLMPHLSYFMGMTWGSGIGVRIFRNGEILCQGEGGHKPLDISPFAPLCACGLRGCAESVLGGESIRRRVIAETEALGIGITVGEIGLHPCCRLDRAYDAKEPWATSIYDLVAMGMGIFLADYQSSHHLPALVWKGTFAEHAFPRIGGTIRKYMKRKLINPDWGEEMTFLECPMPDIDSLVGAAALFEKMAGK